MTEAATGGLMTTAQAAQLMAVSAPTIRAAIRRGDLSSVQAPGTSSPRGRRVTRASVEAFMKRSRSILK